MKKINKILFILVLISLFLPIQRLLAQAIEGNKFSERCGETFAKPLNFMFNVPLPGFPGGNNIQIDCLTLGDYLSYIYKFVIGLVGLLSVFMITVGGFIWIFAGGNSGKVKQAKDYIRGAVTGLLLAVFSYSILYIINPQLVEIKRIGLPVVKKAMLAICPTEPKTEIYTAVRSKKDVPANMTGCGEEFAKKDDPNGATCWGTVCTNDDICSPFTAGKITDVNNAGNYTLYDCVDPAKLTKNLVKTCNGIEDDISQSTAGGAQSKLYKEAQTEGPSACASVNSIANKLGVGHCVWIDYNSNIKGIWSNNEGCRWCPESYYKLIDTYFRTNPPSRECDVASSTRPGVPFFVNPIKENPDQPNGGCKDCSTDDGSESYTDGKEYSIDACLTLLYPKYCNKK